LQSEQGVEYPGLGFSARGSFATWTSLEKAVLQTHEQVRSCFSMSQCLHNNGNAVSLNIVRADIYSPNTILNIDIEEENQALLKLHLDYVLVKTN